MNTSDMEQSLADAIASSWNRARSSEELQSLISRRLAAVAISDQE